MFKSSPWCGPIRLSRWPNLPTAHPEVRKRWGSAMARVCGSMCPSGFPRQSSAPVPLLHRLLGCMPLDPPLDRFSEAIVPRRARREFQRLCSVMGQQLAMSQRTESTVIVRLEDHRRSPGARHGDISPPQVQPPPKTAPDDTPQVHQKCITPS